MAIVKDNILTEGFSGMFGGTIVFRQLRGKTIVSNRPRKPQRESEHQRANRDRFREASYYAKAAMEDKQKKAYYTHKARQLRLPNAYTAAITDYMRRPVIVQMKTAITTTREGCITIVAGKQGFGIASVQVTALDSHGRRLRTYPATRHDTKARYWQCYLPAHLATQASTIHTQVTDAAGNTVCHQARLLSADRLQAA